MTTLEVILGIFAWITVGLWCAYKRDFYRKDDTYTDVAIFMAIMTAPLVLTFELFVVFIVGSWQKKGD
jgi:hypothetical protein